MGLRSFSEEARPYFFGRELELEDLFERVLHKPLTILFGKSGLGKTSLLQAGLAPRLREAGLLPVNIRLRHEAGAPSFETQMLDALRLAFSAANRGDLIAACSETSSLWMLFHDPELGLLGSADLPGLHPVFLLDQFEEIFTSRELRPVESDAFRETLAALVENRIPNKMRAVIDADDALADRLDYQSHPAKVLLSLREDFVHLLERWRYGLPSVMSNRVELRLLTGPQALLAVIEPGRMRSEKAPIISPTTGTAIVRFVAGAAADVPLSEIDAVPPLLSLVCAELNGQRLLACEATIRDRQIQGRSEDILEKFYSESFDGYPVAVREFVEDRLLSDAGYRQSVTQDTIEAEFSRAGIERIVAISIISELVDRRLLAIDERGGVRRLELTHDVLTGVARRSRDIRKQREELDCVRARRRRFIYLAVIPPCILAIVCIPITLWALRAKDRAQSAEDRARQAENKAEITALNLKQNIEETTRLLSEVKNVGDNTNVDRVAIATDAVFTIAAKYAAMGYYFAPSRDLQRAPRVIEVSISVLSGIDYIVIVALSDSNGGINIYAENELGATITKDTRSKHLAGLRWRSDYSGDAQIVFHIVKPVAGDISLSFVVGRRGVTK